METKKVKLDASQKKAVRLLSDLRAYRRESKLNQMAFWGQYGVTQSGGSRYESGRGIPSPTRMLMALHAMGVVSDEDMARASAVAAALPKVESAGE